MPSRAPAPATPPTGAPSGPRQQRRTQATFAALRTGVTAFAVLAGLACYFILAQIGISGVPAVVAGLIFALLVRLAAMSLLRDWLRAAARRRMLPEETPPPPTAPRR